MESVKLDNLSKTFEDGKESVKKISLSLCSGEVFGFLGPNGAGKSTTMNILTGYLAADAGTVKINGISIFDEPRETKKMIGYLPEIPPLYTDMTVLEYLRFVFDLKMVKANRDTHLTQVMKCVKILDVQKRLIKNLSKGYRQRVGFAQALVGNPEILILDEPTVGLDPNQIMEMRALIRALGKAHTIILSTHILGEVSAVCDRYIIINHGTLAAEGNLHDLDAGAGQAGISLRVKGTQEEITQALAAGNLDNSIQFLGSFEEGTEDFIICQKEDDIREKLFTLFSDRRLPILSMSAKTSSLEELFIKATGQPEVNNQ